jgi:hypothetical protein
MANRTAKFVSTIFASVLAGTPLATLSHDAAHAADDCLVAPKDETPEGGHWYYRIDHANKRQCWYLREESEKLSQTPAPNSSRSAKPISPKTESPMQRSVADAHAELPAQTGIEPPRRKEALIPALPAGTAVRENNAGAGAPSAATQQSVIGWRWPDPSSANLSAVPAPNSVSPVTSVSAPPPSQPTPVLTAGPFAAADPSSEPPTYSVRMELAMLLGALALAGIVGSAIFKLVSWRRPRRAKARLRRGANWEWGSNNRIPLSADPRANVVPRRTVFARDLDRSGDADDRMKEFFSHLSKQAPS